MKRLFWAYAWMLLSTGAILTSIAGVQVYSFWQQPQVDSQDFVQPILISSDAYSITTEIEGEVKGVETIVEVDDARPQIVANFLKRYNSPLTPHDKYGVFLVEIADKYDLDFRLLPAIAMQESNLCKKIPEDSFNCLGFGIHARGTLTFESYEANFERAARELRKNYIEQGRITPEDIMRKYTPGSNGSWADSVNRWMAEMRYDDRSLGKELRTNANVLEFVDGVDQITKEAPLASPSSTSSN